MRRICRAIAHRHLDIGADRLEAQEPMHHLLGELRVGHVQIDLGRAFRRDDVDARA